MKLLTGAGILLLVLSACGRHTATETVALANPPTQLSRTMSVQPILTLSGLIAPIQNVTISSTLAEPAAAVYVHEGDYVHAGQILATLQTDDLRATLLAAQRTAAEADARAMQAQYQGQLSIGQGNDQVTSAQASVRQAQQTLAQAQADLARNRSLFANGYVSAQSLQQNQTVVDNDRQAVNAARASLQSALTNQHANGGPEGGLQASNVEAARAAAQSARAQIGQTAGQIARASIVSPVDGVIVNRNLNPGEFPGTRIVFTVQAVRNVYANLNAAGSEVFRVPPGAVARISVPGIANRAFPGRVSAVLGQVDPGSTNFLVKARLPNDDGVLHAGMVVTALVDLPPVYGVGIPSTAFLDDSKNKILIVKNGIARSVTVTERGSDGQFSIVSGLNAGEHVIANGQAGVAEGEKVAKH